MAVKTLLAVANVLLISGCSIKLDIEPAGSAKAVPRSEIATALKQRDRALEILTARIEKLEPKRDSK